LGMAIARELDAPGADGDRLVNGLLASLFVYLERMLLPGATTPEAASQEVARVVEAILAGYAEDLRVPALADLAGLSPRQLERRFGSELGRTPKQFLTEVRVGAAGALLRSTGWPVAQIALAVGFQNPSHFAARFREITGRHPSSVRENDDG
jgi:AraC family transcriptional regulator